ncbi:SDR family NAD(P)-dependent oxidoreductase [Pseudoprimorskyibacter insulae]|uniref:C-factor n=1 Tax=Pseudoprimorskyibacter insulae TaxID=1695997 RepID=A0A2R8AQH4_9RHOB|nr:SDR family NAD(P)-dependent oxidoreductase [Pseudoprimorskyibacter insulae]SPF78220.1 C-factor [Pseudoprimorskyibacter insulae]
MTVMITGANRGIGAELAQSYRARGETVLATSRNGAEALTLDVTDPASHAALAETLEGQAIDLLICNAGVYLDKGHSLADGYQADLWAKTFAANVTGVFLTVQAMLPNLQLAKAGKIAIISSQMASDERAPGGSYIYRSSKAAALNLGRNLATDLRALDIAVGIYHPGWVQTDMGGAGADITVAECCKGLMSCFDDLSMDSTGCFLSYNGQPHPY